jgi:hypothetical protein
LLDGDKEAESNTEPLTLGEYVQVIEFVAESEIHLGILFPFAKKVTRPLAEIVAVRSIEVL